MKTVTFMLRPGTEQQSRTQLLDEIKSWSGIHAASPLMPGTENSEIARMHFLQIDETADVNDILEKLRSLPEVESADHPAARGLV